MKRGHTMGIEKIIYNNFDEDLIEIKNCIQSNLKSRDKNVNRLMDNLAASQGKMARSLFVLIGGGFGSIHRKQLRNIASAVELLHLATLVHDDIIDEANLRRGKATIHSSHGVKAGLFSGDYLFAEAYVLFSKSVSPKSISDVSETIKTICAGEINQFFSAYSTESSIKDYLRRINGKCASLFSLSLSIGAYEANVDQSILKNLKSIGYYTGMAFQLIDDVLDLTSPKDILGKPSGNDIREGIYTLPLLYELKNSNTLLLNYLKEGKTDIVVDILKTSKGLEKTRETAKKYTNKSLRLIEQLPQCEEKTYLRSMVEKMLVRNY